MLLAEVRKQSRNCNALTKLEPTSCGKGGGRVAEVVFIFVLSGSYGDKSRARRLPHA